MTLRLDTPIGELSGIGPAREKKLNHLGIYSVEDLLRYYPRQYEDRRTIYSIAEAPEGIPCCVNAMIAGTPRFSHIRKGMDLVKVQAVDGSGMIDITFFNQAYMKNSLEKGKEYIFYGTAEGSRSRRKMTNPVVEEVGKNKVTGRIVPVYPLTAGIGNNLMISLTQTALDNCADVLEDFLPQRVVDKYGLMHTSQMCDEIHRPKNEEVLDKARKSIIFEELFLLSAGLVAMKQQRTLTGGKKISRDLLQDFLNSLPFELTGAQLRTLEDCAKDMESGKCMNRLVQGDVGSGKTMIAAGCVYLTCKSGFQGALMAPTEILAQQHFQNLSGMMAKHGIKTGLLLGAMTAKEKRIVKEQLANGEIDFVIGTHALLSDNVEFRNLALVVTDEQHRFGVNQRALLGSKGEHPHVLVMSATPIPRTLALIIYGDLDLSVIDELPPGRQPVDTFVVGEDKRQRMYGFVRKLAQEGRQIYLVCPMVEEGNEETTAGMKAAVKYAQELQEKVFPDLTIGIVHGKMKSKEKESVMKDFASGKIQVLVCTTVIEVGVDVPNAALIIIENAERFGLSQLHQLRGRVGRGKHQSYCVLISDSRSDTSRTRLKVLADTNDGFKIAQADLEQRGPGDFFGARQHGLPQLKMADLAGDTRIMYEAREAAEEMLELDPELKDPENIPVLNGVRKMFSQWADSFN